MGDAGENSNDADYTPEHTAAVRKRKRKAKPKAGNRPSHQDGGFGSPACDRQAKLAKEPAAAQPEDEK